MPTGYACPECRCGPPAALLVTTWQLKKDVAGLSVRCASGGASAAAFRASRLTAVRMERGLTQQALAESVGVQVTQIRRYEAATSAPTLDVLRDLAIALHISTDAHVFAAGERGPDENLRLAFEATAIVKFAELLDVSTDYLLLDNAPRRPHRTADEALGTRLATIAELNPDDLTLVTSFIDALVTKTRLKALAGGVS